MNLDQAALRERSDLFHAVCDIHVGYQNTSAGEKANDNNCRLLSHQLLHNCSELREKR